MPTVAIYRKDKLIWQKTFDPPENGVLELDEPVEVENNDYIRFDLEFREPIGYHPTESGRICSIFYNWSDPDEEVEE